MPNQTNLLRGLQWSRSNTYLLVNVLKLEFHLGFQFRDVVNLGDTPEKYQVSYYVVIWLRP